MNHDIQLRIAPVAVRAGEAALLTYTIADGAGKPVTDMEPYLAAMGHLFAVSADGETVIHTHTVRGVAPGSYDAAMLAVMQAGHDVVVTPEMVSPRGPTFTFKPTFPRPGQYKVWAQFSHQGRVVTAPFVVVVAPAVVAPAVVAPAAAPNR
jgi:Cu+-exporting ATPase